MAIAEKSQFFYYYITPYIKLINNNTNCNFNSTKIGKVGCSLQVQPWQMPATSKKKTIRTHWKTFCLQRWKLIQCRNSIMKNYRITRTLISSFDHSLVMALPAVESTLSGRADVAGMAIYLTATLTAVETDSTSGTINPMKLWSYHLFRHQYMRVPPIQ